LLHPQSDFLKLLPAILPKVGQKKGNTMKKVWITSLVTAEEVVQEAMGQVKKYGLEVNGHFWEDDLEKTAWIKPRTELVDGKVDLWLILASEENLSAPSIRYGLSLLALTVQAQLGLGFPIVILLSEGETPPVESLPNPLKNADFLSAKDVGYGAKLVAKVHSQVKDIKLEYRLDAYGNPQTGQWLEVGPTDDSWNGAMLGVSGAEISFHAVGPKGSLPSKSVLNYPMEGLKLRLGEKEYLAWTVQNEVDSETSYFVKLDGFPDSVLFGPYSSEDEAEVHVTHLK
jgi:hypothetical protein